MITETKAIILSNRKHKENSSILTVYSEKYGRVSYVLYGTKSKKTGRRMAFLQPLSLVSIISDSKSSSDLQVAKDVQAESSSLGIISNPYKNAVAMFIAEFLLHALRAGESDLPLFSFLYNSVKILEFHPGNIANFHIAFLVKLSNFLGFTPDANEIRKTSIAMQTYSFFDLKSSAHTQNKPFHRHFLDKAESATLLNLLRINYRNMTYFRFSRAERQLLLSQIVSYYQLHIQGFGEIKSLDVMKEIFE